MSKLLNGSTQIVVKSKPKTNANANVTSGVKFTASKGFRFGGSKVAATEAALA